MFNNLQKAMLAAVFVVAMTSAAGADIEVIDTIEGDLACQTVTFEGNGHNNSLGVVAGTPVSFGSGWRTITSGPYANNPSGVTVAIFSGPNSGPPDFEVFAEIHLSATAANVSFFYASIAEVTLYAYDSFEQLVASSTKPANLQPDGFTQWDPIEVSSFGNSIAKVIVRGRSNGTGIDDFKVCIHADFDPVTLIENLILDVGLLNLANGINNSLDAKLDAALNALDDLNDNNDVAACNVLEAFISHVQAQVGNQISEEDADYLIEQALAILNVLDCP